MRARKEGGKEEACELAFQPFLLPSFASFKLLRHLHIPTQLGPRERESLRLDRPPQRTIVFTRDEGRRKEGRSTTRRRSERPTFPAKMSAPASFVCR